MDLIKKPQPDGRERIDDSNVVWDDLLEQLLTCHDELVRYRTDGQKQFLFNAKQPLLKIRDGLLSDFIRRIDGAKR